MSKKKHSKLPVIIVLIITILVAGVAIILLLNSKKQPDIINDEPIFIQNSEPPYIFDYSWNDNNTYIAHAFGSIDGRTYTNSIEAFYENYDKGHRVFEVDFDFSDDDQIIATHDQGTWRKQSNTPDSTPYTAENFKASLIYDKYHTLLGTEVIDLMAEYPDIYIVTDTKYSDTDIVTKQFSQLVEYAKQNHPETLDRLIPQIYNEDMLATLMSVHPFRSVIFTLYQIEWTPESVLAFCQESGVRFITTWDSNVTPELLNTWSSLNIKVAAHTINDQSAASNYLDMGADAIYTDDIIPNN